MLQLICCFFSQNARNNASLLLDGGGRDENLPEIFLVQCYVCRSTHHWIQQLVFEFLQIFVNVFHFYFFLSFYFATAHFISKRKFTLLIMKALNVCFSVPRRRNKWYAARLKIK